MNKRKILNILGKIIITEVLLMFPSLIVSMIYNDGDTIAFISTMIPMTIIGYLLTLVKQSEQRLGSRDGYFIVALAWIIISLFGACPLYFSNGFNSYWDALFEIVSGFTTTGSSVLVNPEILGHGVAFWRCFTNWIGGMGVLVFVLMIMPMENRNSMHLVRAEVPGHTSGKLVPKMKMTTIILYGIYTFMTIILLALLLLYGLDIYDALCLAFGTAGTGGFALTQAGIAGYSSAYIEILLAVFILLFGINFNVFYLISMKRFKEAFKSEELRWYFGIVAFSTIAITINIINSVSVFGTALRQAFFQVSSIVSTAGFSSVDYNNWPEFSKHMLVLLMIIGACSSSTGGGLKVSRAIILVKSFFTEIRHIIEPRSISVVRLNGKAIDKETLISTRVYASAYFILICLFTLVVSIDGFDFETNLTAVLSCFNNIGPGLGAVGPASNFGGYSDFIKVFLSMIMITGRLEIFPMFILFSKSTHKK